MSPSTRLKLVVLSGFAITLAGGCHYLSDEFGEEKMIPNPLPAKFPYELRGTAYKIWIGNEMQLKSGSLTSYVLMQGVDNPDTGDEREHRAIAQLQKLTGDFELRIEVRARDKLERVIGQVYIDEQNINLEMVRSGWGQYDGSEFAESQEFATAQNQAQQEKRGMWSAADED